MNLCGACHCVRCIPHPLQATVQAEQLLSPSKPPDAWKTHLESTVFKAHHLEVTEGLIPKSQQHRAVAGSSSMSFRRQAMLPQGQLHSRQETQTLPLKKELRGLGRLAHEWNLCAYMCTCVLHVHENT